MTSIQTKCLISIYEKHDYMWSPEHSFVILIYKLEKGSYPDLSIWSGTRCFYLLILKSIVLDIHDTACKEWSTGRLEKYWKPCLPTIELAFSGNRNLHCIKTSQRIWINFIKGLKQDVYTSISIFSKIWYGYKWTW